VQWIGAERRVGLGECIQFYNFNIDRVLLFFFDFLTAARPANITDKVASEDKPLEPIVALFYSGRPAVCSFLYLF